MARHYGGGHILFFDGRVDLARGDRSQRVTVPNVGEMDVTDDMIRYWEPDYDQTNPGY